MNEFLKPLKLIILVLPGPLYSLLLVLVVNPRRACSARVTVVVPCVCVYVCLCVHSNLSSHTLESQKRDTNGFITIRERF